MAKTPGRRTRAPSSRSPRARSPRARASCDSTTRYRSKMCRPKHAPLASTGAYRSSSSTASSSCTPNRCSCPHQRSRAVASGRTAGGTRSIGHVACGMRAVSARRVEQIAFDGTALTLDGVVHLSAT
eukprot:scaffold24764_cov60-Phaeocystis_antarctica.AAC.5